MQAIAARCLTLRFESDARSARGESGQGKRGHNIPKNHEQVPSVPLFFVIFGRRECEVFV